MSSGGQSKLCFLALVLVRVAENATGDTWPVIAREMDRMHLGTSTGTAGVVQQRTVTTPEQAGILTALGIPEPPLVLHVEPAKPRRRKAAKPT